jgi:ATP-dependent DNA ligase
MSLDSTKLKDAKGYLEGAADAVDEETAAIVANYRKDICKKYISLNPEQIDARLGGTKFFVTRKYDGELAVLFWDGNGLFSINSGGRVRKGLPCMEEAAKLLAAAGVREAVVPAELIVEESGGRARVFDTLAALADPAQHARLRLAPFDILRLDGEPFRANSYEEVHARLGRIFGEGEFCRPVRCEAADSKAAVKALYAAWVEDEGGEGLVVRSEFPIIYKVKPRYTLDAAVIGFSEGAAEYKGQIRSLLLALMPKEGVYQIVGHVGGGFDGEQRKAFFDRLLTMKTESSYIETDSNHVAFHMVRPEIVVEIHINDVLFETTSGAILNPLLAYDGAYRRAQAVPGISIVFPVFERVREDKTVNASDVRFAQVDAIAARPAAEGAGEAPSGKSELLRREVYKKETGGKLMVQKFLVWKTNKGADYPGYVLSHTNFSSERKDPLQSEVRVSDDLDQIQELCGEFVAKNVKKGWVQAQ